MPEAESPVQRSIPIWQIAAALVVGLVLYLLAGNDINFLRAAVVGGAVIVSLVSFINSGIAKVLDQLRNPTHASRRNIAIAAGALGALYLFATAKLQDRSLLSKMEDECSYVIGTQLLAHGRLWLHAHPMADFFEALFVIIKPVYCSIYFPGTSIFFALGVWLHLPTYVLPLVISGAIIAMLYRIITELLDGVAGLLACFWIIALEQVRTFSVMIMSHLPMLLLGLLMFWAWMNWRKNRKLHWALLLGIFAGWGAITRPADAVAYALPIGIAILAKIWRETGTQLVSRTHTAAEPAKEKTSCVPVSRPQSLFLTGATLIIGAAPFLALQVIFDIGVTKKALHTPYTYSLEQDQPGAEFGFHRYDPSLKPATSHPGKLAYYDWCKTFFEQHQFPKVLSRWVSAENDQGGIHNAYLVIIADNTMPSRLLLMFIPVGLLGLRQADRRVWVLLAIFFAFCFIYFFNPFFLAHYQMVVIPAVALCALRGASVVIGNRSARFIGVPIAVLILALSLTSLWEFKRLSFGADDLAIQDGKEGMLESSRLSVVNAQLAAGVGNTRALVLFGPKTSSYYEEPVYNTDVANIDDAPIVRAHDLGARNIEIIRYYAERQPDRLLFICNLAGDPSGPGPVIHYFGTCPEVLGKLTRGEPMMEQVPPNAGHL